MYLHLSVDGRTITLALVFDVHNKDPRGLNIMRAR